MRFSTVMMVSVLGITLHGAASAQIYESKDAEGVPEFSDTPTAGATVVDLPATNTAEAPAEGALRPEEAPVPQAQVSTPAFDGEMPQEGGIYYGNGDEDDDVRARRRAEEHVDNALPGHQGPGVGAPGPGVEPREGVEAAPHHSGGRR